MFDMCACMASATLFKPSSCTTNFGVILLCCTGPGPTEEEEGMSPLSHVMDDSGAPSAGGPDPEVAGGVVEMPDSEALRRSVAAASAAEHERQAALSNGSQPAFDGQRGPVSAASSGT